MMLAIMSYNTGVFFSVIGGLTLGYYVFNLNGDAFLKRMQRKESSPEESKVMTDRGRKGSINREKDMINLLKPR